MLFRTLWFYGWVSLILLSIMALWDVSEITCGQKMPILLSRALTTDPWRGLLLVFCLMAVAGSFLLNSVIMFLGFLGFFSAFLVSMFQTNAHNALIAISSIAIMYECYPQRSWTWKVHWWSTAIVGSIFVGWLVYSELDCETLQCSECSYFYISEYVFFWSMFLLVWWRIPEHEQVTDHIEFVNQETEETNTLIEQKIKF